jgi:hypothetical protein
MKTFTIQPDDKFDITFRLVVCNTRKEMRAAIKKDGYCDYDVSTDRTMGMFRPTPQLVNGGIPGDCFSNMFGTMYLNLDDIAGLGIEVIAHECAHAAFTVEYNIRHYTGTFDDDGFAEQETYCYFLGKAVEKVTGVVRKICKTKGGTR